MMPTSQIQRKPTKAFTLVEILVALTIISTIASLVVVNFSDTGDHNTEEARNTFISTLRTEALIAVSNSTSRTVLISRDGGRFILKNDEGLTGYLPVEEVSVKGVLQKRMVDSYQMTISSAGAIEPAELCFIYKDNENCANLVEIAGFVDE